MFASGDSAMSDLDLLKQELARLRKDIAQDLENTRSRADEAARLAAKIAELRKRAEETNETLRDQVPKVD